MHLLSNSEIPLASYSWIRANDNTHRMLNPGFNGMLNRHFLNVVPNYDIYYGFNPQNCPFSFSTKVANICLCYIDNFLFQF